MLVLLIKAAGNRDGADRYIRRQREGDVWEPHAQQGFASLHEAGLWPVTGIGVARL